MSYVIRSFGLVGTVVKPFDPGEDVGYLAVYDIDAEDGRGRIIWTLDPSEAIQFDSVAIALAVLNMTPAARPNRQDGRPNRPIRAFTTGIEVAPNVAAPHDR